MRRLLAGLLRRIRRTVRPVPAVPAVPVVATVPEVPAVPVVATVLEVPAAEPAVDHSVSAERMLALPYVAAVAVVTDPSAPDLAFPDFAPRSDIESDPAVPPRELWTVAEDFLGSGQHDADQMLAAVGAADVDLVPGTRVLDFGCGPGRVLRWLPQHIDGWGIDLDAGRIAWCQQALSPPFRFATCGTYPHLSFADGTFDLVYAGSVFTHISELADAWLLELLRITAPGGVLYLTIHDRNTVEFCRRTDPESWSRALTGYAQPEETEGRLREWADQLGRGLDGFTIGRGYYAQVFYDRDALVRHWGRYAEVVDVVPNAFALHQTAVVLRRRADDRAWR